MSHIWMCSRSATRFPKDLVGFVWNIRHATLCGVVLEYLVRDVDMAREIGRAEACDAGEIQLLGGRFRLSVELYRKHFGAVISGIV
jgi:hypothetical protein